MEQQRAGTSPAGNEDDFACRPGTSGTPKPLSVVSEEGSSTKSRAILATLCVSLFLMATSVLPGEKDGSATAIVLQLNEMFDRVWCPLPTWAHIGLVIAAWALFFRVGADFLNTMRKN